MVAYLNFHTIAALLNGIALGAMLFFAIVVTPVVFKSLLGPARISFLETIFPLYFRAMMVLEGMAGLLIIYRFEGWVLLAVAAGFLFADAVLRPRIERHRPGHYAGDEDDKKKFRLLHRLSVLINLTQIIVSLIVFFRLAI